MKNKELLDLVDRWCSYGMAQSPGSAGQLPGEAASGWAPHSEQEKFGDLDYIAGVRTFLGQIHQKGSLSGSDWIALAKAKQEARQYQSRWLDSAVHAEQFKATVSALKQYYGWAQSVDAKKMEAAEAFLALGARLQQLQMVIILIKKTALKMTLNEEETKRMNSTWPETVIFGSTLFEWEELLAPSSVGSASHERRNTAVVLKELADQIPVNCPELQNISPVKSWDVTLQICRKVEERLPETLQTYATTLGIAGEPSQKMKKTNPLPLFFKGKVIPPHT